MVNFFLLPTLHFRFHLLSVDTPTLILFGFRMNFFLFLGNDHESSQVYCGDGTEGGYTGDGDGTQEKECV